MEKTLLPYFSFFQNQRFIFYFFFFGINGNSVFSLRTCAGGLKVQLVYDVTGRHEPREEKELKK